VETKEDVMTQATETKRTEDERMLHVAFELSEKKWVLAFSDGRRATKARLVAMESRDLLRLKDEIGRARERFGLEPSTPVVSCYEAGRDGFWIHRYLESIGVSNVVVDAASIEVNRRRRHRKTDRIDARKLLATLLRYHAGEKDVWSVVRVPSDEDEDERQLHRELEELKSEAKQHRVRIQSLLVTQGISMDITNALPHQLPKLRRWDGSKLPAGLTARLRREHLRLTKVQSQIQLLTKQRRALLRASKAPRVEKARQLMRLKGLGENGSWLFVMEFFGWRTFNNRKEVAGAAGLVPTPYDSGDSTHEQGISKSGNGRVRYMAVELAWCWLRWQPQSRLSQWFAANFASGGGRKRRVGIVAVARKLLIALWRFVERGQLPEGAICA
jgi:transposase